MFSDKVSLKCCISKRCCIKQEMIQPFIMNLLASSFLIIKRFFDYFSAARKNSSTVNCRYKTFFFKSVSHTLFSGRALCYSSNYDSTEKLPRDVQMSMLLYAPNDKLRFVFITFLNRYTHFIEDHLIIGENYTRFFMLLTPLSITSAEFLESAHFCAHPA